MITDVAKRNKAIEPENMTSLKAEFVDFCDDDGNYMPATLGARVGTSAGYTLTMPGDNPVDSTLSSSFINTHMPGANDQVLVATPRCTMVNGKLTPDSPAVLDARFIGLSSGFYADFVPIEGVTSPYQASNLPGVAERINISYMWTRIGAIVTLHGTAIVAGDMAAGTDAKYIEIQLPIPLSDNAPVFSGATSYISTTPDDNGVGTKGRGANARDPRFFGSCDMVTSTDMNQSNVAQWNNFKISVYPKEWTRNKFRLQWVNSGDNSPDAQFRFHVTYSLAPIMPNKAGTFRYVVDRAFSNTDPGNWD